MQLHEVDVLLAHDGGTERSDCHGLNFICISYSGHVKLMNLCIPRTNNPVLPHATFRLGGHRHFASNDVDIQCEVTRPRPISTLDSQFIRAPPNDERLLTYCSASLWLHILQPQRSHMHLCVPKIFVTFHACDGCAFGGHILPHHTYTLSTTR